MSTDLMSVSLLLAVAVTSALGGAAVAHGRSVGREARLRAELAVMRGADPGDRLVDAFRSASSSVMQEQSEQLLRLAETRYHSLERSAEARWAAQGEAVIGRLSEYSTRLGRLEEQRQSESAVLAHAVAELRQSNEQIRDEARGLASALRDRAVRGTWGEVQLRRVLEQSGMVPHSDFVEQQGVSSADASGRPDVVVRLPNGRTVVIDAKAPLDSYLGASAAEDPEKRAALCAEHGRAVARHVAALSRRRYEEMVEGAVDFVVMFVPGDAFLSAAFEARPGLLEEAARQNVILASPGTLMAFLRGVACGWRERQVAEEAQEIARLGRELHERVARFGEHFLSVGSALSRAVVSYNQAVGSMERRLLVTARRIADHGAGSTRTLPVASGVAEVPVAPSAPELAATDLGVDSVPVEQRAAPDRRLN
jgi:DNA recombination protein RmuC